MNSIERRGGGTREDKEKLVDKAYVMTHPLRFRIVRALYEKGEMYVAEIARAIGMKDKAKLVAFHLNVLAEHGLVESRYGLRKSSAVDEKGRPVVVNYFRLTDDAKRIIKMFNLI